jgi:hypothetical protein
MANNLVGACRRCHKSVPLDSLWYVDTVEGLVCTNCFFQPGYDVGHVCSAPPGHACHWRTHKTPPPGETGNTSR